MFRLTFLGHQGWSLRTARSHVLIDALLRDELSHSPECGLRVYPPRQIDLAAMPPLTGVIISHEHEDHFDPGSLLRLDRSVPIYLSSRSSIAARELVTSLGFRLRLLQPGGVVKIGDLNLYSATPDHLGNEYGDEWDVMSLLLWDDDGDGNLLTTIDLDETPELLTAARRHVDRVAVLTVCNNAFNVASQLVHPVVDGPTAPDAAALGEDWRRRIDAVTEAFGRPPAMVATSGDGFWFEGALDWMNRNSFVVSNEQAARALSALRPQQPVCALEPGHSLELQRGEVVGRYERSEFVQPSPCAAAIDHTYRGDVSSNAGYGPACGRRQLSPADYERLRDEVQEMAKRLFATSVFRILSSVDETEEPARKPRLALVTLFEGGRHVFEHEPHAACMREVDSAQPTEEYLLGLECWASDLLALARGELTPHGIVYGRCRVWGPHVYGAISMAKQLLTTTYHPLVRPDLYRRVYARLAGRAEGEP